MVTPGSSDIVDVDPSTASASTPTGRTPAPPYADIPAAGASPTPRAAQQVGTSDIVNYDPSQVGAGRGQSDVVSYDPTQGPGIGREVAAPVVSGLAGLVGGTLADLPSTIAEAAFINPARHMAHDIGAIVSGEPSQQWAKEAKDIEQHPLVATGWGTRGLERGAEAVGLPTIETAPAQTWGGRLAQRAVATGIEFAGPGWAAGKAAGLLKDSGKVANLIKEAGEVLAPGSATGSAAIGATTGAVQQTAAEAGASPETQKVLGLITPAVAAGLPAVARYGMGKAGIPISAQQRQEISQERAQDAFAKAVSDPVQAAVDLRQGMREDQQRQQTVPGAPTPTTAEMLNDPNLLRAQRIRERQSDEVKQQVMDREAQSNDAQWRAIHAMADPNTNARDTQTALSFYRETLDQQFAQQAAAARAEAERTGQAAQPTMSPEQHGEAAQAAIDAVRAPLADQLQRQLQDAGVNAELARDILGGIEPLSPEARFEAQQRSGQAFREATVAVDEAERQRMHELWQALDPTNTMSINKYAINNTIAGIRRDFEPKFFSPDENKLYSHVDEWGDQVRLQDAFKFRSEVNSQLRNRNLLPDERLRLTKLRQGIDQATDDAVNDVHQTQTTAAGGKPTTTVSKDIIATLDKLGPGWVNTYAQYLRSDPAIMRKAMRDPLNAEILRRTDPNTAALGEQTLRPMDAATQQQYREANEQYQDWKQRMQSETGRSGQLHAVGKMLEPGGAYDEYKLPDHRVPASFIEGQDAPLAVDRFISAVGAEVAQPILENAFKLSLRSQPNIMNANGTMNLTVFNRWFAAHQDALSRMPALLGKFQNAADAHMRLQEAEEAFAQHQRDYPLDRGLNHSAILGRFFKPGPEGGELMQKYRQMTGENPEALTAAEDYAAYKFADYAIDKNTGMVNANRANTWISQHALALGQIPGLRNRFLDAATAQRTFEETLARHNRMRAEFDKSVAGTVLGADIDKVAERLLKGSDRAQRVTELMNILDNMRHWRPNEAEAATEGLKRAVIDHIYREYGGGAKPGSEYRTLKAQQFSDFINSNEPVLRTLFGNGWKVLETVGEDAHRAGLVQNAKRSGGSDTAELLQGMGANRNESWWPWFQGYAFERLAEAGAQAIGHAAGATTGHIVPVIGPFISWAILSRIRRAKENLNLETSQAFDHLLMHPEAAADMLEAYTNPKRKTSGTTMQRYFGRIVQGMIQSSEGHGAPVPRYFAGGRVWLQEGGTAPAPSSSPLGEWNPGYFGHRAGGRVRLQGGGDTEPAPAAPPVDVPPSQSIAARMVEPQPEASLLPPESGGQQYLSQGPLDSPTVPMSQVVDPSLVFTPGTGAHAAYEQNLEKAADVALSLGPGISVGRVYHGSPHKFAPVEGAPYGRFDISRMGSGQGAQTFGEGAYFAEAQPVAEGYKGEDVGRDWTLSDETGKIPSWVAKDISQHQPGSESYHARIDTAINEFQNRVAEQHANIAANRDPWMSRDRVASLGQIVGDLQRLKSGEVSLRPPGYLYDVDVAAEQEHFLDWDKPLSEQPDEIKKMLGYEGIVGSPSNDEVIAVMRQAREAGIPLRDYEPYKELQSRRAEAEKVTLQKLGIRDDPGILAGDLSGSALYTGLLEKHGTPWEVAKYLGQLGLKGIRYLDQGSRAGGRGTRNYVIFDPGPITTITGRRNSGGPVPRAPSPPAGVFWRGGAVIPQATPYRFH